MNIYSSFNWPGKIWITSDLHLNHTNIIKFEREKFKSIEHHDKTLINNITKNIRKGDTLIILGDLGFGPDHLNALKDINCNKVLIKGNHDKLAEYKYKEVFNEIYKGPILISPVVMLSHYPIQTNGYFYNIHGHLHNEILNSEFHINLSSKLTNYEPIPLIKLLKSLDLTKLQWKNEAFLEEWYVDDHLFMTRKLGVPCYKNEKLTYIKTLDKKVQTYSLMKHSKEIVDYIKDLKIDIDDIDWDKFNKHITELFSSYTINDIKREFHNGLPEKRFIKEDKLEKYKEN